MKTDNYPTIRELNKNKDTQDTFFKEIEAIFEDRIMMSKDKVIKSIMQGLENNAAKIEYKTEFELVSNKKKKADIKTKYNYFFSERPSNMEAMLEDETHNIRFVSKEDKQRLEDFLKKDLKDLTEDEKNKYIYALIEKLTVHLKDCIGEYIYTQKAKQSTEKIDSFKINFKIGYGTYNLEFNSFLMHKIYQKTGVNSLKKGTIVKAKLVDGTEEEIHINKKNVNHGVIEYDATIYKEGQESELIFISPEDVIEIISRKENDKVKRKDQSRYKAMV